MVEGLWVVVWRLLKVKGVYVRRSAVSGSVSLHISSSFISYEQKRF